jgi:PAS domain S-box-containing protein
VDPPEIGTNNLSAFSVAALLSAIVDSSDDAIVSKTLDGIIMSWNRAAESMFGYTAAEAIGRHITLIIPPERHAEEEVVLEHIRRGDKLDHFETIRQTKDGRRLNISLTVSPIKDSQGRVIGASKSARDITEKKRMERELQQQLELLEKEVRAREKAQATLAEALSARDDFIAVAAHEFRNPLNVFVLTLQLLHRVSRDAIGGRQVQDLVEKSRIQLGRLSVLVDRLLDVTRIRTGTFELCREMLDLSGLIREVVTRFAGEPSPVPILLDLEPAIVGYWDRIRIDQALTNLLSNAIKYGKQKPISVRAHLKDNYAVIRVWDQGIGIPPEKLELIFERFERAGGRSGNEGLGLGLWITKQIVEAHGGRIVAESKPGEGSVFTMSLPVDARLEAAGEGL